MGQVPTHTVLTDLQLRILEKFSDRRKTYKGIHYCSKASNWQMGMLMVKF